MRLLTLARDLGRRKGREKQGLFIAEGVRSVEELLRSPLVVRGALVSPQLESAPRGVALVAQLRAREIEILLLSQEDFDSAAETDAPQGILAIAEIPERTLASITLDACTRLIILDAVQDPGNVGTIIRTAAALGAAAVITMPGTVDAWNAKVVRGAMGASFHLPVFAATWDEVDVLKAKYAIHLWGADANGVPVGDLRIPDWLAIVLGNEGAGLSPDARQRADSLVSLPINSSVESLNVAVAAGILLYQLRA